MQDFKNQIKEKINQIKSDELKRLGVETGKPIPRMKDKKFSVLSEKSLKSQAFDEGKEVLCGCRNTFAGHNHSYFSILDGVSSPEDMVDAIAQRGFMGMGFTEHHQMGSVLRGAKHGKEWKVGRLLSSGIMINFKNVSVFDYSIKYQLAKDSSFEPLDEKAKLKYLESIICKNLNLSPKDFDDKLISETEKEIKKQKALKQESREEKEEPHYTEEELEEFFTKVETDKIRNNIYNKFLSDNTKFYVVHNVQDRHVFRILDKKEFEELQKLKSGEVVSVRKVDLNDYPSKFIWTDDKWNLLSSEAQAEMLSSIKQKQIEANAKKPDEKFIAGQNVSVIHHNLEENKFRVIDEKELETFSFKVLSGNEFYVSWEAEKDKHYNHITVYATGAKGHRALVLLTSIGAIPSRRYVRKTFFRPRIFMEDLEKAIIEAEGELIVTTGCPIGYVSSAIRENRLDDARKFLRWGQEKLGRDRFFVELHICDVSLDFNRLYSQAEDKYYAQVFGSPVSRLKLKSYEEAFKRAERVKDNIINYVIGESTKVNMGAKKLDMSNLFSSFDNEDQPHALYQVGIKTTSEEFFKNHEQVLYFNKKYREDVKANALALIKKAVEDIEMKEFSISKGAPATSEEIIEDQGCKTDFSSDDDSAPEESTPQSSNSQKLMETAKKLAGVLKKQKSKKMTQLLDEESLSLLLMSYEIIFEENINYHNETTIAASKFVARFVLSLMTEISMTESIDFLNPKDVIKNILQTPKAKNIGHEDNANALYDLAKSGILRFDEVLHGEASDELDEMFSGAAKSLFDMLSSTYNKDEEYMFLQPKAGSEEEGEKEWTMNPEGNWMEHVNRELVKLAREFDIPLILGTDAHMTDSKLIDVQDAIMKRGKRKAWHMSRPYSVPRGDIMGYLEDVGIDWTGEHMKYLKSEGNCAFNMLKKDVFKIEDIIEAFGTGSLLLSDAKCASKLKWETDIPRIRYTSHKYYAEAKEFLDSGKLKEFLFAKNGQSIDLKPYADTIFSGNQLSDSSSLVMKNFMKAIEDGVITNDTQFKFTEKRSLDIATSLIVTTFFKAIESGIIPNTRPYYERMYSELYLQQEVGEERLCDFFLVLQHAIDKWRIKSVSVGPGRGSSGGMLTAMVCGITYGDPIKKGFLESRWMNAGRKALGTHADIDVDVSDRQIAGYELALIARDAFEDEIKEFPLTNLESVLHQETFFSSEQVTHQMVAGRVEEMVIDRKKQRELYAENLGLKKSSVQTIGQNIVKAEDGEDKKEESWIDEDEFFDNSEHLKRPEDNAFTVWGTPLFRVGTYGSLKAKAAVKEAIRIADSTPFNELPSFEEAPPSWRRENSSRISGKTEDQINYMYEDELHSHMSLQDRWSRRRVRLGDRLTKEMTANAGLVRLYQSEMDFFMGAVYGISPNYWEGRAPSGAPEVKKYYDKNPEVKKLTLEMLNIFKAEGVHAGGMCFGRKSLERVPLRPDKHGYVAQLEMKYIEYVGVLKFDVLGLSTLTQISETLKMISQERAPGSLNWLPEEVHNRVLAGESTDIVWRYMPLSTYGAIEAMCSNRAMTFQIDTPVFGKELSKLQAEKVKALIDLAGQHESIENDKLVDILNAFLALFRPGPMALGSHIKYIQRLLGNPYKLDHEWEKQFLDETFGLIVYQEQVMAMWKSAAKGSDEETDNVRRAMGKKDVKALKAMKAEERFVEGATSAGVPLNIAEKIWKKIIPFAEYGFNAPHSYHYGLVSGVSLFLKSHFKKEFFRVTMGLAKNEDAAKFLEEIQKETRPPCVLRSDIKYWDVVGDEFFPGLESIEGLNKKAVEKVLKVREGLEKETIIKLNGVEFFRRLCEGKPLSKSLAKSLSQSGALRVFGDGDSVAKSYANALVKYIYPEKEKMKDAAKENFGGVITEDDGLSDFIFETVAPVELHVVDDDFDLSTAKIAKADQDILNVIREYGINYQGATPGQIDQSRMHTKVPTVKSATRIVTSNKTRGAWCRWIVVAKAREEAVLIKEGKLRIKKSPLILLRDFKNKKTESGKVIEPDMLYRTIAIPESISNSINQRTGDMEVKVKWLADGTTLNTKFSKKWNAKDVDEIVKALYDGKMVQPFEVTIKVGEFSPPNSDEKINYYHIEKIEKLE